MSRETLTVRVDLEGPLVDHVVRETGADGAYASVEDYLRDLIRRDMDCRERAAFSQVQAELQRAFAQPDDAFKATGADDIRASVRHDG